MVPRAEPVSGLFFLHRNVGGMYSGCGETMAENNGASAPPSGSAGAPFGGAATVLFVVLLAVILVAMGFGLWLRAKRMRLIREAIWAGQPGVAEELAMADIMPAIISRRDRRRHWRHHWGRH